MRVIRTELYNDDVQHEYKIVTSNLGVAFAWFKTGELAYPIDEIIVPIVHNASNEVPRFLDIVLQGVETRHFEKRLHDGRLFNKPIVDYLLDYPVVVERSPPEAIPFSTILKKSSSSVIGTLIGVAAARENTALLFVTVPAGIIVVGSAFGIAKGLERGLATRIEKLMKWKPKQ
jgi:hypothetical protein